MSSILLLTIILAVLMTLVGGKKGLISFFSVLLNFVILFVAVILISVGITPIGVTIFAGLALVATTIYMGNDEEKTTNVAFIATVISMGILLLMIIPFDKFAAIQGFSPEQSEEIEAFNLLVGIKFESITISITILSTLGAIAEAAIAVASGLDELMEQNPNMTLAQLYESGRNIGFQIMGMTFNTLFFGMFGGDLALFILIAKMHANFGYYLNSKIFVSESIEVLFSSIAIIFVIVMTTYLMGRRIKNKELIQK